MTDEHLTSLFAEGTAPERDTAFARSVDARIARARSRSRLVAVLLRTLVILTLAAILFVTVQAVEPVLAQVAGNWPQLMGVPLPLVLCGVAVGLAVHYRRLVRFRLI